MWATMASVVKMILNEIPNFEALCVSSALAFVFLLAVNIATGKIRKIKECTPGMLAKMAGLGFIGLFLYGALYYEGLDRLSSQEACITNYVWPIMLVIFSVIILKEKMTKLKAGAMICSFIGIVVLCSGETAAEGGGRLAGIACCIIGAAMYGLFSVLNKKADLDQNITMMVIWLTVAVCAGLTGALTDTWVQIHGAEWIGMIWLGVVVNALAYLLWALALKGSENTAFIANRAYLTPFLSILISAVLLNEKISLRAAAALVFIVGGILVQSIAEQSGRPAE